MIISAGRYRHKENRHGRYRGVRGVLRRDRRWPKAPTLALSFRRSILAKRSRNASVTTRAMLSPVAWEIACAKRQVSGFLMLRLICEGSI